MYLVSERPVLKNPNAGTPDLTFRSHILAYQFSYIDSLIGWIPEQLIYLWIMSLDFYFCQQFLKHILFYQAILIITPGSIYISRYISHRYVNITCQGGLCLILHNYAAWLAFVSFN